MSSGLYHLTIGLGILTTAIFLLINKNSREGPIKVILILLVLVFAMESIGHYLGTKGIQNTWLYNIGWVYIESLLLILYFYLIEKEKLFQIRIMQITIGTLGIGLINSLFFQPIGAVFQFFTFLTFSLFILFLCIRFLKRILTLTSYAEQNLIMVPHFWIVTGMLFFYSEAIVYMGLFQFYPEFIKKNINIMAHTNRLMAGMMYLFFGFAYVIPHFLVKKLKTNG